MSHLADHNDFNRIDDSYVTRRAARPQLSPSEEAFNEDEEEEREDGVQSHPSIHSSLRLQIEDEDNKPLEDGKLEVRHLFVCTRNAH